MNPEIIIATLLNTPAITTLVGNRRALGQLPQNSTFPALVFNIVDSVPQPNVAFQVGKQMATARIQFNPLAVTINEIKQIQTALRNTLDFKHQQTVAGKLVISCRLATISEMEKDTDADIWTQSVDYILRYYE
jgi:hypothetical protein